MIMGVCMYLLYLIGLKSELFHNENDENTIGSRFISTYVITGQRLRNVMYVRMYVMQCIHLYKYRYMSIEQIELKA